MTLETARQRVGAKVVYRAPHVRSSEPGEEGIITEVGHMYVFVRYGSDLTAKATPPELLDLVTP
ncbi:hypothetical protein B1R94_02240 [Mycolicibacterium litorale]|nr:hypothetical protein B1R94_02240 [Mycolicibacterium litorale]